MGTFKPETPIFDGKNPWVSGSDFPNKTNPLKLIFQGNIAIYCWYITNKYTNIIQYQRLFHYDWQLYISE